MQDGQVVYEDFGDKNVKIQGLEGMCGKKTSRQDPIHPQRELFVPHSFLLAAKVAVRSHPVHGRTEYSGAAG